MLLSRNVDFVVQIPTDRSDRLHLCERTFGRLLFKGRRCAFEDLYAVRGRTVAGRYLIIYFVYKSTGDALVISAREMTKKEKKAYAEK